MTIANIKSNKVAPVSLTGSDELTVHSVVKLQMPNGTDAITGHNPNGMFIENDGSISDNQNGPLFGQAVVLDTDNGFMKATIINDGTMLVDGDGIELRVADLSKPITQGSLMIANAGTIESTGGWAINAEMASGPDFSLNISNNGLIDSLYESAIVSGSAHTIIDNTGRILAGWNDTPDASRPFLSAHNAILFKDGAGGTVSNDAGTIIGGSNGINAWKGGDLTVFNQIADGDSNSGIISGLNGSGISTLGSATIWNIGHIWGNALKPRLYISNGDGINVAGHASIQNYGDIMGIASSGKNTSEGVHMGGGDVHNYAGGLISGANHGVVVDDGSGGSEKEVSSIINDGTITGKNGYGIHFVGGFDDTVVNSGTISGSNGTAILFGDGDNTLTIKTGSTMNGVSDGGKGLNTLDYSQYGSGVDVDLAAGSATGTDGVKNFAKVVGSLFSDHLVGDDQANFLDGKGGGNDYLAGGNGNDSYVVRSLTDTIDETGTDGIDVVRTALSFSLEQSAHVKGDFERLYLNGTNNIDGTGNALDNQIMGNDGNNILKGLGGHDFISGGNGNDWLYGGTGNDTLTGGVGADHFVFDTALNAATNIDLIMDFNASEGDKIELDRKIFGSISESDFAVVNTALDASKSTAHLIYDTSNGTISYGTGHNDAVVFAHVTSGTTLSFSDFNIF